MLKFDDLGWGPKVNPNGYAALLNEAKITDATLQLAAASGSGSDAVPAKTANGSIHLRHVGTGVVAEGHFGYKAEAASGEDSMAIKTDECVLTVKGSITRVVPEGSTDLDLSGLFNASGDDNAKKLVVGDCVVEGGATPTIVGPAEGEPADKCIVRLAAAAPKAGTKVTVNFVLTTGAATTHNNAETVNLDPGDYQIHLVARARNDNECTRMPNPTMMEFVKHCRPLNIRW